MMVDLNKLNMEDWRVLYVYIFDKYNNLEESLRNIDRAIEFNLGLDDDYILEVKEDFIECNTIRNELLKIDSYIDIIGLPKSFKVRLINFFVNDKWNYSIYDTMKSILDQ